MTPLEHALAYAARGWRVHPLHANATPRIRAWQDHATADPAKIVEWWGEWPTAGIGVATGAASGIWVLDVDTDRRRDKHGDDTLAELEALHGPLPDTYEVITGSGGRHLYFAWDDGAEIRNSASGVLGPDLDVRGEGGYVVAPPTPHRLYGTPFEQEAGAADDVATAPAWLVDRLTAGPAGSPAPLGDGWEHVTATDPDAPGVLWAVATSWAELLGGDGWTHHHTDRTGEEHWTRPGKTTREGTSATVGYGGSDVLKVFTSSLTGMGLQPEGTYTKFGYLAATRHGGDHRAAAQALRNAGWSASPAGSVADILPTATTAGPDDPWPDPKPWEGVVDLPPFPLTSLPEWAIEHTCAAAEARQVPVDLCAMLAIGALSAALTGRATIWPAPGWDEPVNLYLLVAMRSGAGKSPAEKAMAGWLRRWEASRMLAAQPAHEKAAIAARVAEKAYRKAADGGVQPLDDILALNAKAQELRDAVPALPRVIIDDATPEAVATLLAAHDERLAILSTEADLFDMLLSGRAGSRPSLNVYLKAWSGDSMKRDRKGSSDVGPEATILRRPLLTVSVTVQPSVLARALTDEEMRSRGFAARFMFSCPADLMGRRDQRRRFRGGDLDTAARYDDHATALADRWARWSRPADLHLSDEAAAVIEDWFVEMEPTLAPTGAMADLAEWVAKLQGSVIRYAGLLHLAEGIDAAEPVGGDTAERAVDLGRYWAAHAMAVAASAEDPDSRRARLLLEWIEGRGAGEVTIAEMQAGFRRPGEGLDKVADYIVPVRLLIDHGWLRPVDNGDWSSEVGVRRAKSPRFAVSPFVGESHRERSIRVNRVPRIGGERTLSLPTHPTDPPGVHAVRGLRGHADSPDGPSPVENLDGPQAAPSGPEPVAVLERATTPFDVFDE